MGGSWPKDYCVIDCETTGFSPDRDVVTEWGHALVVDGKVTDSLSLVIDWTDHPIVPDHWLRTRLDTLRQNMALNGATCHMTYARMKAEGMKPNKALAFIRDFTTKIRQSGMLFVAHSGVFDERMLSANMQGFRIADGFSFGDDGWIDTDCVERASQCVDNERMHPRKGDTLRSYWHRVKYTKVTGLRSNLSGHCHAKYGFAEHGFTEDKMHGAETDCLCTALLMEAYREIIAAGPVDVPAFPLADHKAERTGRPVPRPQPMAASAGLRVRGQRNC